ncbi:hypothetical protein [Symmachiella dynata]|uniref:hypothetical protein n=1 Tax=Symmachiella dynata TaxID=2527995 RepID=UPI00119F46BE|nr:hypothetical protein [Symmachiella dynata]
MKTPQKQQYDRILQLITIWFVMGAAMLLALTYSGPEVGEAYIADEGLVQMGTLVILVVATLSAATLAIRCPQNRVNLGLLACGLAIYAGREHDLHRLEFLSEHYTLLKFYLMPEIPLWQKLFFGAFVISVIAIIATFVLRMVGPTLRDLKRAEPWAIFGLAWITTLTASQISDRTWLNSTFAGRSFEEVAEFVAAGLALMVVYHFPRVALPVAATTKLAPQAASAKAA